LKGKELSMRRLLASVFVLSCLLASGCAMCCAPFDWDYPYVGGSWVRHNPSSGRVGSKFDEAGGPAGVTATGEPTPAQPPSVPADSSSPTPAMRSAVPRNLGGSYLP
jgi:hypothetical protein